MRDQAWDVIVVGAGNAALCAALSAAEYAAYIKKEQARWSKVVRAANVRAD